MSDGRASSSAANRVGSGAGRLVHAWRSLPHDRRLAAFAAAALFLTLFLPWYQETVVVAGTSKKLVTASQSLTGWAAFSFVEAAVLVVAVGVLSLLFQRAEGRAFHLPGGDGGVILAAGGWTCVLVIWRIFDKQGTSSQGQVASSSGIEWGIFIALAVAAFLAYAGSRIRAAHQPEPPLPGEDGPPGPSGPALQEPAAPRRSENSAAPGSAEPRRAARRRPQPDRPVGWLSAPSEARASGAEEPPTAPAAPAAATRQRHPSPVPADQPVTAPTRPRSEAAAPPAPAETRRQRLSDEQLTIPLEPEDRAGSKD